MSTDTRDEEWAALYETLKVALAKFDREDAFGDGDYWLVDDDYGGVAQKLCVHRLAFLDSSLITMIQAVLTRFPGWNVLVQLEAEIDGHSISPEGIVICPNHVEQHWDRLVFADVIRALGI